MGGASSTSGENTVQKPEESSCCSLPAKILGGVSAVCLCISPFLPWKRIFDNEDGIPESEYSVKNILSYAVITLTGWWCFQKFWWADSEPDDDSGTKSFSIFSPSRSKKKSKVSKPESVWQIIWGFLLVVIPCVVVALTVWCLYCKKSKSKSDPEPDLELGGARFHAAPAGEGRYRSPAKKRRKRRR